MLVGIPRKAINIFLMLIAFLGMLTAFLGMLIAFLLIVVVIPGMSGNILLMLVAFWEKPPLSLFIIANLVRQVEFILINSSKMHV